MDKFNKFGITVVAVLLTLNLMRLNSDFSSSRTDIHELRDDVRRVYNILERKELEDEESEKNINLAEVDEEERYGLYYVDVLTVANKNGEKKSYLITESDFDEKDYGVNYKNFSFKPFEKYFDDIPNLYVTRVERVTYSRVGSNSVSPIAFKTRVFAQNSDESYRGCFTIINSLFGSYESRSVYKVNNRLELCPEYTFEKNDSEFEITVQSLRDVLGIYDTNLSFTLDELSDIENEINDRNFLTLS